MNYSDRSLPIVAGFCFSVAALWQIGEGIFATSPQGKKKNMNGSVVVGRLGTVASNSVVLSEVPEKNNQNNLVQPKSGINFVLYNGAFDVVEENTGYLPVDDKINAIQNLATDKLVMTEAGFIEIFVNNEAQTPVYYDNLTVTHRSGSSAVMEVNAYYPFGMMIPGLSVSAWSDKKNYYKWSTKEIQEALGLNWYDHGARMYDPEICRWMVPDPMAEWRYSTSPYAYCLNNPINRIDPTGMLDLDWEWLKRLKDKVKDFFTGSSVILSSQVDWQNFDTEKDKIGLSEVTITAQAPKSYTSEVIITPNKSNANGNISDSFQIPEVTITGQNGSGTTQQRGDGYGETFGERLKNIPKILWNGMNPPKAPHVIQISLMDNPISLLIPLATLPKAAVGAATVGHASNSTLVTTSFFESLGIRGMYGGSVWTPFGNAHSWQTLFGRWLGVGTTPVLIHNYYDDVKNNLNK